MAATAATSAAVLPVIMVVVDEDEGWTDDDTIFNDVDLLLLLLLLFCWFSVNGIEVCSDVDLICLVGRSGVYDSSTVTSDDRRLTMSVHEGE